MHKLKLGGPVVAALAAVALSGCRVQERGPLKIAERGAPAKYSIVLPDGPGLSQAYAAEELRDHVEKMTGVRLPIVTNAVPTRAVYLEDATATLGDDAFRIFAKGRDLHIAGGKRGVLYGVYEILERFGGCGWFTSWRTVIPERAAFEISETIDDTQRPAFLFRMTTAADVRHNTRQDFKTRLRFNAYGYSYGRPDKFGGESFRFVKGSRNCHTFLELVPPKKYFADHPEYFSEVNGVRRNGQTQLCLTNSDVEDIVVREVLKKFEADPTAEAVGISQDDWANYCTCPKCKAVDDEEGAHSGSLVRFLNRVAERVCARLPNVYIETLAYQYTRKPPKKTRLHPRVVPCLCSIECDFSKPLSDATVKANAAFREDLVGWSKMTDNLYLWDYTTDYRYYLHPFPNVPVLQDNVKFFRDHSVKFLFEEAAGGSLHADMESLKTYLISKFLWNPDQPMEPLVDRFINGVYGKAAPYARAYYDRYMARCKVGTKRHMGCFAFDAPELFPDDFIDWAWKNWQAAEKSVQDDPTALFAVRMAEMGPLAVKMDWWTENLPRVWVTCDPCAFKLPADEIRRTYAAFMDRYTEGCKAVPGVRLGNLKVRHDYRLRNWKTLVDMKVPEKGTDSVSIPCTLLDCWNETRADVKPDKAATDGQAFCVVNHVNSPSVYLNIENVAYDKGAKYRARIRVKVERVPNAKGEAFLAKIGTVSLVKRVEEIPNDDYQWYDLGTTELQPGKPFEFRLGRFENGGGRTAVTALWLDRLELTRADAK